MKKWLFIGLLFFVKPAFASLATGDLVSISTDTRFQNRVNFYLQQSAINVVAESTSTANHPLRVAFAKSIITGTLIIPFSQSNNLNLQRYAIEVLTNSSIAAEATLIGPDFGIPDGDIQFAVQTLFNAWSGVST